MLKLLVYSIVVPVLIGLVCSKNSSEKFNFNFTQTDYKAEFERYELMIIQAYRFASNEYRLFPLRFQFNYCAGIENNIVGMSAPNKCAREKECPLKKDQIYRICNFTPNPSKMPPFIPDGRYMIEVQATYLSEEIYLTRGYLSISRPIVFS
ncbi:hypothetical protein ILUMI_17751 [Ignelater luminosus]|uniref:Uncharacterized protein n=1 Tax=Ignelater luminosus TaxID=2038154 RepID=A0A8K0CNG5_IGNLU|nr:hypothetical protein ILUMI_17751 [Ignelater luminosus]